jgi:hypothetical protein
MANTNLAQLPKKHVDHETVYDTICFRVPAGFRRRVKMYAAAHDMKLGELLQRAFNAYEASHGGRDEH